MPLCQRVLLVFATGFVAAATPVKAAIICDGSFQIVRGEPVSTPYCQDEDLAASLRKHGAWISGDAIRKSSELKRQSCVATGDATSQTCANYLGD